MHPKQVDKQLLVSLIDTAFGSCLKTWEYLHLDWGIGLNQNSL